jgi:monoamine oxidase
MPTLFTALRTHLPAAKTQKKKPILQPFGLEMLVKAKQPTKKRKERIYKLSLTERFHRIHRLRATREIIVVGGGFAGLSAAFELSSVGYKVTVLEAQTRVGGRVKTLRNLIPGRVAEGGAELIGSNHHAWLSYQHQFHLHLTDVLEPPNAPVILGGWRLSSPEAAVLGAEFLKATRILDREARSINPDTPWTSPMARSLDRLSLEAKIGQLPVSQLSKLALREQLETDNGVPAERQSYLGVLAMIKGGGCKSYWEDTEVYRCREGNDELAKQFRKRLPKRSVRFNSTVRKINLKKSPVEVTLTGGESLTADDVVLAAPPSVWKKIKITPALPGRYQGQFGKNVKFLMDVRKNSWKPLSPAVTTDGPVDLTWQGTDQQPGPRASLVCFSGSKDAETCRKWKNRKKEYLARTSAVYPGIIRGMRSSKFMDWVGNKWTRGSYSFPAPGEVTTTAPLLRKPFEKHLHFSGEHTCNAFVGYMEGALQSGLRVAEALAKRDKVIAGAMKRRRKP